MGRKKEAQTSVQEADVPVPAVESRSIFDEAKVQILPDGAGGGSDQG